MSFWNIGGGFHTASAVDAVLDKPEHTVREVLEAEDVLKEVLSPNERLIDFLCQPEVLDALVDFVVDAPRTSELGEEGVKESGDGESKLSSGPKRERDDGANDLPEYEHPDFIEPQSESTKAENKLLSPPGGTLDSDSESDSDSDADSESDSASTESDSADGGLDNDDLENDEEREQDRRKTLAKVATKILSADVWSLLDALLNNRKALDKLWTILELGPGDPEVGLETTHRLDNFTVIIENLLEKRTDQMLDYIRTLPHFVDYIVRYVDNPPLVDFLLKVISTDYPDSPTEICEFLYHQGLMPKMIAQLGPEASHSAHVAAGEFLKAFVTISGGNKPEQCAIGPNELSRQFVSEPCLRQLIELMLHGGHGMGTAVSVIIEIIRKNNSDYDEVQVVNTTLESHPPSPRDPIYLGTLVSLFTDAIPEFQNILTKPHEETIEMPFGSVHPLGNERFRICELYAELLHCSNMALLNDPQGGKIIRERDEARRALNSSLDVSSADNTLETPRRPTESRANTSAPDRSREWPMSPSNNSWPNLSSSSESSEEEEEPTAPSAPEPEPSHPETCDSASDLALDVAETEDETGIGQGFTGEALQRHLEEEERQLRMSPVVGDRLKIALDDSGCISRVLAMLFEFPWNNFLHNVVFDFVQQIFNGPMDHGYNKFLAIHLFTRDHITERIVQGHAANDQHEREKNLRLGYVGHLTLISEEVVKFASMFDPDRVSPEVATALQELSWVKYVDTSLLKLREQYNTILGDRKMDADTDDDVHDDDLEDSDGDFDDGMDLHSASESESGSDSDSENSAGSSGSGGRVAELSGSESDPEPEHVEVETVLDAKEDSERDDNDDEDGDRFFRYLGHQLSGSSRHDDDDDDEEDAWVPVGERKSP